MASTNKRSAAVTGAGSGLGRDIALGPLRKVNMTLGQRYRPTKWLTFNGRLPAAWR